jgi:hypothetical protein
MLISKDSGNLNRTVVERHPSIFSRTFRHPTWLPFIRCGLSLSFAEGTETVGKVLFYEKHVLIKIFDTELEAISLSFFSGTDVIFLLFRQSHYPKKISDEFRYQSSTTSCHFSFAGVVMACWNFLGWKTSTASGISQHGSIQIRGLVCLAKTDCIFSNLEDLW